MRTAIAIVLMALCGLAGCNGGSGGGVAESVDDRTLRYAIASPADCEAIQDYPYARNLFCPAAFAAAQAMRSAVAQSLGADETSGGFFSYYQTLADPGAPADDQSQTTVACQHTHAPWPNSTVVGAGAPLCRLLAHAASPGPTGPIAPRADNPVPDELRAFPAYFRRLYAAGSEPVGADFASGGAFDPLVRALGAAGRDGFVADYPSFASDALYDPADWREDPSYHGISGGGGSGWGGEVVIERQGADPVVVLAFGGGGGGGMTSSRTAHGLVTTVTTVGAGGGGGMQLADGYRHGDRAVNGLGLGAGVGSDEATVQYSYYDVDGSTRPPRPVHEYNAAVIEDFQVALGHLVEQLIAARAAGATIVVRGGGGMGAGAEYLAADGGELAPDALSTQAGFQYRYQFSSASARQPHGAAASEQGGAYAQLGEFYRDATRRAFDQCGRDYANYPCICVTTHAIVVCRMEQALGDASKLPVWLRQQHCPDDPAVPPESLTDCERFVSTGTAPTAVAGSGCAVGPVR